MSEVIKRMLAEREKAEQAHEAALRRELVRRMVETRKAKFVIAFTRQQRFYRERYKPGSDALPKLPLDTYALCEGAELASDPGWDAERAWNYSETRQAAIAEVEVELERRREGGKANA